MTRLLNYFLKGLVLVVPVAITVYVTWRILFGIDSLLGFRVPGAGFVVTLALITLVGFLATNLITRGALGIVERVFDRLPFVRLLYSSTRDLLEAFVGEQRRFDRPVLVTLIPEREIHAVGFVTRPALEHLGTTPSVAVYLPMSYSVAGHVLIVPASQVRPLTADAAEVMAFAVSGGVAGSV